ncbi:MAG: hypothetical protein R3F62_31860, partial [Planctomycetota bacterium]
MSWTATLVTDDASARAWLGVPEALFAGQPGWRPRVEATAAVFDPARNPCFEDGVAARWVLRDAGGALAGRVAAFGRGPVPDAVGGIGFFACVDAQEAAAALLSTAEAWLREQGFLGADAPINFGERDRFWGLRVHGSGP